MHKEDLIKHLSKKYRRPQKHYQEALTEILEGITDQLKQGKPVHLLGFGSFYTRMRQPSENLRLILETPQDSLGTGSAANELERHRSPGHFLLSDVDDTHAAGPDNRAQRVAVHLPGGAHRGDRLCDTDALRTDDQNGVS